MHEERTEEPSARRLQDAAAEGRSARTTLAPISLALSAALLLAGGAGAGADLWIDGFRGIAALLPALSRQQVSVGSLAPFVALLFPVLTRAAGAATFLFSITVLFAFAQSGFKAAPLALRPRWRQQGIAALTAGLSAERCSGMLLGLGTIAALAVEASLWLRTELVIWAGGLPFTLQVMASLDGAKRLGWHVALTIVLAGAFEFLQQRARHAARLRMTPREARDDRARSEAKPELKQRRRTIGARRARSFRLSAIKRASALITNPQHLAVALRYAPPAIDVPTVVARGAERRAAALREAASALGVPIIQSAALARALYARFDVDEQIAEEHYAAVAAVFAWILKTHGKLRRGDESE